jgi:hypothetical protein
LNAMENNGDEVCMLIELNVEAAIRVETTPLTVSESKKVQKSN